MLHIQQFLCSNFGSTSIFNLLISYSYLIHKQIVELPKKEPER
jgi:hypothetical protein